MATTRHPSRTRHARALPYPLLLPLLLAAGLALSACNAPAAAPTPTGTAVPRPTRPPATAAPTTVPTAVPTAVPSGGEFADEFAEAEALRVGEESAQTLSSARSGDWFSFTPTAGRLYRFATTIVDDELDTVLRLYDRSGELLAENDDASFGFASLIYYQAQDDAPLYLQVAGYDNSGRGLRYNVMITSISVGEADAYENDDRRDVAPTIDLDEEQDHTLHTPIDTDWAEFDARAGELYRIVAESDGELLYLTVVDEADDTLTSAMNEVFVLATRDETLAVQVTRDPGDGEHEISYVLGLTRSEAVDIDDYEPDDNADDATALTIAEEQRHTFHTPLDTDWALLEVAAGDVVAIATTDLSDGLDTVLALYDEDGNQLDYNDDAGQEPGASLITYYADDDTRLLIQVSSFSPPEPGASYRLIATRAEPAVADEFEPDNGENDAKSIDLDRPQQHSFHRADDVDYVTFPVEAGTAYQLATSELSGGLDTVLELYDSTGNLLVENDDFGSDRSSRVIYLADRNDELYAVVRAYGSATPGQTYTLTLQLTEVETPDAYEPDDRAAQAGSISIGDEQRHTFHLLGDTDWTELELARGDRVLITTSDLDADVDTMLSLYDDAGNLLDSNDDIDSRTLASQIEFRADRAITLLIEVRSIGDLTPGAGYTLSVSAP